MLRAAVTGARAGAAAKGLPAPRVLAVTVLTSLSAAEVTAVGWSGTPAEAVLRLGTLALRAGVDGAVCSPREAEGLRRACGPNFFLCTPGIRSAGEALGDQSRAETPAFAVKAGADLLVVGRPIHAAADPASAARALVSELT